MSETLIRVNTAHFAAALHLAARNIVRFYLVGVYVEATRDETRCVATDGCALGVLRHAAENRLPQARAGVIVPYKIAGTIARAFKEHPDFSISAHAEGGWTAFVEGYRIDFEAIDARYPDYRRAVPTDASGVAAQFDPELLARFAKVAKALGVKARPVIHYNGQAGAAVTFRDYAAFAGVAMPLREQEASPLDVTWVRHGG